MKPIVLVIALAALVPSAFAADNTSSRRYGTSEALSVQDARLGEVLMVRPVQLKSDKKVNAGSAIGAAVGYGASRKVDGDYRNAARVAGGVIGGVAGTAIQNGLSGRRAIEIYVRDLSDKRQRVIAIVQDADVNVREGDQVFLVGTRREGGKNRSNGRSAAWRISMLPGLVSAWVRTRSPTRAIWTFKEGWIVTWKSRCAETCDASPPENCDPALVIGVAPMPIASMIHAPNLLAIRSPL